MGCNFGPECGKVLQIFYIIFPWTESDYEAHLQQIIFFLWKDMHHYFGRAKQKCAHKWESIIEKTRNTNEHFAI